MKKVAFGQLRLFDTRHICERCTEAFEKECGYKGCWMGWHFDGKQHPEKALCQLESGSPAGQGVERKEDR